MERMKKLPTLVLLLCGLASLPLRAAEGGTALIVHAKDGTTVSYLLAERPLVTCSGDSLLITCGGTQAAHALADVAKYTFGEADDADTGVSSLAASDTGALCRYDGEAVVLSGIGEGGVVTVLTAGGTVVRSERCGPGSHALSLNGLPGGVYLVNVNGTTFKLSKK